MDEAFAKYTMVPLAEPRVAIGSVEDGEGILGSVRYGSQQNVTLPLDAQERERVYTDIHILRQAEAPVNAGQILGVGRVMLDGDVLASYPVVALERDGRRTFLWYAKQIVGGYLWRTEGEAPGFKNISRNAGLLRAANARN
jgi:hypothetical protein